MLGLAVIIAAVIYLALLLWVTRGAFRWAKAQGFSRLKCWFAGTAGFLLVYLPVFWDWFPTILANQYYCGTEAGFRVIKTIDRWKVENPGIAEKLTWQDLSRNEVLPDGSRRYFLNERMIWEIRRVRPISFLSTTINQDRIFDQKTGELLASQISVSSGYPNPIAGDGDWRGFKVWLNVEHCDPMRVEFSAFQVAAKRLGERK